MDIEEFATVAKAIAKNPGRPFSLLLGNGFSMSYDKEIFSYSALHEFVEQTHQPVLERLFEVVATKDFEQVMKQLELLMELGAVLELDPAVQARIKEAKDALRRSLIDAIRGLHPQHVFKVPPEKIQACADFLRPFLNSKGSIFTANYDLLLYWVLMRSGLRPSDGFGKERESEDEFVPEEMLEYSELKWGPNADAQQVYYLHGALPLFDTGTEVIKEVYSGDQFLLERITRRIDSGDYPVFVTAGDAHQKLIHINHNPYLHHCYNALSKLSGSLVTFGFNFGAQDGHIVEAINRAAHKKRNPKDRLWSLYIGTFSSEDRDHIESLIPDLRCQKVHILDSKTANVWS